MLLEVPQGVPGTSSSHVHPEFHGFDLVRDEVKSLLRMVREVPKVISELLQLPHQGAEVSLGAQELSLEAQELSLEAQELSLEAQEEDEAESQD